MITFFKKRSTRPDWCPMLLRLCRRCGRGRGRGGTGDCVHGQTPANLGCPTLYWSAHMTTLDLMTPALVKLWLINSFVTVLVINIATMNAAFGICVASCFTWMRIFGGKKSPQECIKVNEDQRFWLKFWSFIYRPHFLLIYFYLIPFSIHFTHSTTVWYIVHWKHC